MVEWGLELVVGLVSAGVCVEPPQSVHVGFLTIVGVLSPNISCLWGPRGFSWSCQFVSTPR